MSDYRQFGEPVAHPIHMRATFSKGYNTGQWIGGAGMDVIALDETNLLAGLITGKYTAAQDTSEQQNLFTSQI
jgi:hypothetical protein